MESSIINGERKAPPEHDFILKRCTSFHSAEGTPDNHARPVMEILAA